MDRITSYNVCYTKLLRTMPDFLDIDSDNDGVFDFIEGSDANSDGIADVIRIYVDSDHDGLDDSYDDVPGWAMPGNETGSNAPLQDFDNDGVRDWRDTNDEDDEYYVITSYSIHYTKLYEIHKIWKKS